MKLIDLDAEFLSVVSVGEGKNASYLRHQDIARADGIMFQCPKCFKKAGGPEGVHYIICWTPKIAAGISPGPGRWNFSGTSLKDLTLSAKSSSIDLTGPGCRAHFYIKDGEIIDA